MAVSARDAWTRSIGPGSQPTEGRPRGRYGFRNSPAAAVLIDQVPLESGSGLPRHYGKGAGLREQMCCAGHQNHCLLAAKPSEVRTIQDNDLHIVAADEAETY